jgi:hypothetical protein
MASRFEIHPISLVGSLLFFGFFSALSVEAQAPRTMHIQGTLTDGSGIAVSMEPTASHFGFSML